jgi:hypothetical protein
MTTTGTAALVTAVETTWAEIRETHPDTPEVIVTVRAGSGGKGGGRSRAPLKRVAALRTRRFGR